MDKMTSILLLNMCMIVDEKNKKVLVQDKVDESWGGITFPGGHIENGESIVDSTVREVKEETGLDVQNLKPCGLIHWHNADDNERWFIFLFKTGDFSGTMVKETEEGEVYWVDIDALPELELAPDMDTYLKLFFDDNVNEAYATWNAESSSGFSLM